MDDITLEDVPDELVQAVLRKLPAFYREVRSGAAPGENRLSVVEKPGGSFDVEIGRAVDHERVTVQEQPTDI